MPKASAAMVLSTVFASAMQPEDGTMRNSNLLPVKAKGEVRLRSVASRRMNGRVETPTRMMDAEGTVSSLPRMM